MLSLPDHAAVSVSPLAPSPSFPYRIVKKVGEGAMGVVYQAENLELGRYVAIKVVRRAFMAALSEKRAEEALRRFQQEARAAASLSHPGVTTVYRVGTEAGWPYIVMEWLDGQSLDDLLHEHTAVPYEQAARLGIQVLAGLTAAHDAGIVHRDIKPGNLMVTHDARVKITDFGVARVQGSDLAQTQAGLVLGTPQYAAPEQLAGRAIDCRADLYALGVVLYEAIVGDVPFDAPSIYEIARLIETSMPAEPSSLVPGIPPALDAVLLQALARDPADRFRSAHEMALALQPFVNRETKSLASTRPPPQPVTEVRAQLPVVFVEGHTPRALVAGAVRRWPATALGRKNTGRLLERVVERPFHTRAFCGALEMPGACLLVCDGIIHGAFDPTADRTPDEVIESLPDAVDTTLYALPEGADPRLVPLLASLLIKPKARASGLDSAYTNLPDLADKLASEGFDGALHFGSGALLGYALFSKGERVMDLLSEGWPGSSSRESSGESWERWIAGSGAIASIEDRRAEFPSMTLRQQLEELELEVVRPAALESDVRAIRSDSVAEARTLQLLPRDSSRMDLRRGESTLQSLVDADPAHSVARWVLVDLEVQFAQYDRTSRWKALVEPLSAVREVRLHHAVAQEGGGSTMFDAVTYGEGGRMHHLIDRVALGTRRAVEDFFRRAIAAKRGGGNQGGLGGAILVAPSFDEEALEAYLGGLRTINRRSIFSGADVFSHREGYLRLGARSGFHVLLVEETDGRRRPLVPG
ncbi:MAG: hypothetical protein DRJ42_05210 [Deltaproteobacteria bacterium]|nr:MAG: hypothetical protein DRJ42_05210 [Deltaproteobacteria bacterium]